MCLCETRERKREQTLAVVVSLHQTRALYRFNPCHNLKLTHRIQIDAVQAGVIARLGHGHRSVVVVVIIAAATLRTVCSGVMATATVMVVVGRVGVVVVQCAARIQRTTRRNVRRRGHRIVRRLARTRRAALGQGSTNLEGKEM